jgi:hypothetical protein
MGTQVTAGPGDPCTWGPCTGHPNNPRTPELTRAQKDELFEQAFQKHKKLLTENVCCEESKAGTSHGVTEKIVPTFASTLADLPKGDITRLMNFVCWGKDFDISELLETVMKTAIDKVAEIEALKELGY